MYAFLLNHICFRLLSQSERPALFWLPYHGLLSFLWPSLLIQLHHGPLTANSQNPRSSCQGFIKGHRVTLPVMVSAHCPSGSTLRAWARGRGTVLLPWVSLHISGAIVLKARTFSSPSSDQVHPLRSSLSLMDLTVSLNSQLYEFGKTDHLGPRPAVSVTPRPSRFPS